MCDICQEVCPFNRDRAGEYDQYDPYDPYEVNDTVQVSKGDASSIPGIRGVPVVVGLIHGASATTEPAFQPRDVTTNPKLTDLLYMTQEEFSAAFKGNRD